MKIPLNVLLTISEGRLFCEIDQVYTTLKFLTGDSPMSHQIYRLCDESSPFLKTRYPILSVLGWLERKTWKYLPLEHHKKLLFGIGRIRLKIKPFLKGRVEIKNLVAEWIEMGVTIEGLMITVIR